jgi:predicted tellurium resistance membrane protein TerC
MDLFTLDNLVALIMLIMLQAVLGFDNLLYISLESKRAPLERQAAVRRWGIGLAIVFRIILLFLLISIIEAFTDPLFEIHIDGIISGVFNLHAIIELIGGVFILYTAVKEIMHMMSLEDIHDEDRSKASVAKIVAMIVVMNVIFSFDSILSAMALSDVFAVMATAILISGALMIYLADTVSEFLQKNRMYEVLGLFILFIVGIMLLSEGGHLAHLKLFGKEITPMSKTTFYFVIVLLILSDVVQGRYRKKIDLMKQRSQQRMRDLEQQAAPTPESWGD